MATTPHKLPQLQAELKTLLQSHHTTNIWFRRTGAAALAAAGLWILIYLFAQDNIGVKKSLAIIVGSILMWLLFVWAFFLLRKLNRITARVRRLEVQLIALIANEDANKKNEHE
jgi:hypothetical protein